MFHSPTTRIENPQADRPEPALEVYLLGMVDFDACLFLQERIAAQVNARADTGGGLIVCEHPGIVTIGREGSLGDLHCDEREFASRLMEVRRVARGGGCMIHIPGQLAAYPILPLERLGMGIAHFREGLELAVVDLATEMRIETSRRQEQAGVWSRQGQIAAVGAAIRQEISRHGLFLNVNPRIDLLELVRWGRGGQASLESSRHEPTGMASVREALVRRLAARFAYSRYHLHTGHPLLRRTRKAVAYA
jgi:lipoyl(octanoyl) transferase